MEIDYAKLQAVYAAKGYRFFDQGAFNLNLFGIRNASAQVDEFNDWMGVAFRDEWLNPRLLLFRASTKPGLYYLKHKILNVNGTAILIPGQYRGAWKLGHHNGYEALQQRSEGVFKVWRDADHDAQFDYSGPIYTDVQGLNGHTTSFRSEVERVNRYSAGCQVVQDDLDFNCLMLIVKKSLDYFSNSFSYTLLEEGDCQSL
ncbi:hypothetical protein [Croceimicrobium sp.]|uniref:hypothetical protein n=1 Tax=Croceimicrobium sp. TaxID=2828340 RepID=UPI003BAB11C0